MGGVSPIVRHGDHSLRDNWRFQFACARPALLQQREEPWRAQPQKQPARGWIV